MRPARILLGPARMSRATQTILLVLLAACAAPWETVRRPPRLPADPDPRQPRQGAVTSTWVGAGVGVLAALAVGVSLGHRFERVSVAAMARADLAALPDTGARMLAGAIDVGASEWARPPFLGPLVFEEWMGVGAATSTRGHGVGLDIGGAIGVPVSRGASSAWIVAFRGSVTNYFSAEAGSPYAVAFLGDVKTVFVGLSVERITW